VQRLARHALLAVGSLAAAGCGFRSGLEVATGDAWVVESISVHESHGDLVQGESNVPISVMLVNRAAVAEPTPELQASVRIGEADVSHDFTIGSVSATPSTKTIAAGGELVLDGMLAVDPDAVLGEAVFAISIGGVDSTVTATLPIRKRATLVLAEASTPTVTGTTCVGLPTTATYSVGVANSGDVDALFGNDLGVSIRTDTADVTDSFAVSADAPPSELAHGASTTLTFHLQALAAAGNAIGAVQELSIVLRPGATDARTGGPARFVPGPFESDLDVHKPALINPEVLAGTPATVTAGQTGLTLTYKLTNTGGTSASLTGTVPALLHLTTPVTAEYTITPNPAPSLPVLLAPGNSLAVVYLVDVGAAPTAGEIVLRPDDTGTDQVCGTAVQTNDAVALWTVQ
jgi:hypothetical protein